MSRTAGQDRQQVVRGNQMGIDRQAQNPQTCLEVNLPDGLVPVGRPTFKPRRAPHLKTTHGTVRGLGAKQKGR